MIVMIGGLHVSTAAAVHKKSTADVAATAARKRRSGCCHRVWLPRLPSCFLKVSCYYCRLSVIGDAAVEIVAVRSSSLSEVLPLLESHWVRCWAAAVFAGANGIRSYRFLEHWKRVKRIDSGVPESIRFRTDLRITCSYDFEKRAHGTIPLPSPRYLFDKNKNREPRYQEGPVGLTTRLTATLDHRE
ncbi:hypothetical protein PIB30_073879 [Stylosanthes scabra]|uniref:Uncharacterized protein n=1 Tax=Stylosanthes scabra TaxID=79078 RepID=A0ABU6XQV3_9FABA|nr:hypothetical protein [Stylosanthes scabra]